MKDLKEYLPLLTICLLYFGFCNLHFYYQEFKIDIYNYISTSEIILSFLPTIVLGTAIVYSYTISEVFNKAQKAKEYTTENAEVKKVEDKQKVTLKTVMLKSIGFYFILYGIAYFGANIITWVSLQRL